MTSVLLLFVTRLYEEENELSRQQKKEIEELNKAENNFFSSMSHEIHTPINTIIGLNEIILRGDIPDDVAENARNIQSASKLLLTLINDILNLSKIKSGKMEYESKDMPGFLLNSHPGINNNYMIHRHYFPLPPHNSILSLNSAASFPLSFSQERYERTVLPTNTYCSKFIVSPYSLNTS